MFGGEAKGPLLYLVLDRREVLGFPAESLPTQNLNTKTWIPLSKFCFRKHLAGPLFPTYDI